MVIFARDEWTSEEPQEWPEDGMSVGARRINGCDPHIGSSSVFSRRLLQRWLGGSYRITLCGSHGDVTGASTSTPGGTSATILAVPTSLGLNFGRSHHRFEHLSIMLDIFDVYAVHLRNTFVRTHLRNEG